MKAFAALVAAVCVVLIGGAVALVASSTSPPPASVLSGARHFVARQKSVTFVAAESLAVPAGTGASLVRSATVRGGALSSGGADFAVVAGSEAIELRAVGGAVWVRSASSPSQLAFASWARTASYTQAAGSPSAALVDELSSGTLIGALLDSARSPHRHGSSVRTIDVTLDPSALGSALAVSVADFSGSFVVDGNDHVTALTLHLRAADATVDVRYALTWGAPVVVTAPA